MKIGTTRVETFSDGVISIVITIMVLNMRFPRTSHESEAAIRTYLLQLTPEFISYAFSFMMIGIFWINHHHMFHLVEKTDESLLLLNLLFLFSISLIPLSTATIASNLRSADSVAVYGVVLLLTTLSFALMRRHTIRKGLVHHDQNPKITQTVSKVSVHATTKNFIGAMSYLLSVICAYFNIYVAYFFFLIPPVIFFIPDGIDDEKLAEKIAEKNK
jgi:uncharacterized membrane protein